MKTLKIGIAGYDQMKSRSLAIAGGEHTRAKGEPKVWFTSIEGFAKLLSEHKLTRGERGKLIPRVPYDQVRLDVSLTGTRIG